MRMLCRAAKELWHLFVEDRAFAASVFAWPCFVWLMSCRLGVASSVAPETLATGMIGILVFGALRYQPPGASR
jgi:hypothetical protein